MTAKTVSDPDCSDLPNAILQNSYSRLGSFDYATDTGLSETDDYILFVHGWRMQPWERRAFAETSFKRLYWSGFKGKFGFFSWPTGWFYKPAYAGSFTESVLALQDPQNYNNSEAVARRSGLLLRPLMDDLKAKYSGATGIPKVHVMAHSMGNVVVSEALKDAYTQDATTQLVATYIATQSAEAGAAFNPLAPEMLIPFDVADSELLFEDGWRLLNNDSGSWFDIPPNKYRNNTPNPRTSVSTLGPADSYYYKGIKAKAGSIVNFSNGSDYALRGWRFNQGSKPDAGSRLGSLTDISLSLEAIVLTAASGLGGVAVLSETLMALASAVDSSQDIDWTYGPGETGFQSQKYRDLYYYLTPGGSLDGIDYNQDKAGPSNFGTGSLIGRSEILSHIIPSRARALGSEVGFFASGGEVRRSVDLGTSSAYGFTAEAYDHSAQYLSSYQKRKVYWDKVLKEMNLSSIGL